VISRDYIKNAGPITTVWESTPDGPRRVRTFPGLPFGTDDNVFIEGLGEAQRSGLSGTKDAPIEVQYTLKK